MSIPYALKASKNYAKFGAQLLVRVSLSGGNRRLPWSSRRRDRRNGKRGNKNMQYAKPQPAFTAKLAPNGLALGLFVLALFLGGSAANAMSLRELRALEKADKQGANYVRYYLVGVMEGVLDSNKAALAEGRPPSICISNRRLEPAMAQSLFDAERKRNREMYEADMPVSLVMRHALQSAYPCN